MPFEQSLDEIVIQTKGEGFTDITSEISQWVNSLEIKQGILNIMVLHTSCSLIINENADPRVLSDLSTYMRSLVPEEGARPISGLGNLKGYLHSEEGKDDMPAHIRTSLTTTSLSLTINKKSLILGTWQAVYLWEHRYSSNLRHISLHALGER